MRSRYSAYALGLVDYIIATTDPDGPRWESDQAAWRASIRDFAKSCEFRGVTIHEATHHEEDGVVEFTAELWRDGENASFRERSTFVRRQGRWLYHSAEPRP